MKPQWNKITLWFALFFCGVCTHARFFDIERYDDPKDWDSVIFSLQWPITTCLKWKEPVPSHTCILPYNKDWTIHGVWPTKAGTEGPSFCNRTWTFDLNQVQDLKPELTRLWPNIHGGVTFDSLWKHEWEKHGTCAARHQNLASEELYFSQGLKWAKKFNMNYILGMKNILPHVTELYNATQIWQAIRDGIGFDPSISCDYDKETKMTYLSEIRVCFYRDLTLTDCTSSHFGPRISSHFNTTFESIALTNCPINKLISYPDVLPPSRRKLLRTYLSRASLRRSWKIGNEGM